MFYLVIDLEMCRVPRDYRNKAYHYAYETIQIGAVLLNEEFKQVGTIREYVHPEHGVIDPFIEKLTGIKNSQVKKAPCIGEALVHMIDWIGDRKYKVYAWSESDRNQLLHEITAKQITDESVDAFMMEDRWVDYQMVFSQRFQLTRRISLEEALGRADIDPKGKFHDGMDDAVETVMTQCELWTDNADMEENKGANVTQIYYSHNQSSQYFLNYLFYYDN